MAIIVYRSTDASAPVLTGQAGQLIALLDACLVNGYGAKPAAGWTKAFTGTNLAAYRMTTTSPATGFYLRVDDTGTTTARAVGYETMSDVNTGTGPFPTSVQFSGGLHIQKSNTADAVARPWILVADNTNPRAFYLNTDPNATVLGAPQTYTSVTFFGDLISRKAVDGYQCAIIANIGTPTTTSNSVSGVMVHGSSFGVTSGHYIARSYTGVGGAVQNSKSRIYRYWSTSLALGASDSTAYPNRITNTLDLALIMANESAVVMRGTYPGWFEPQGGAAIAGVSMNTEVPGQGALAGQTFLVLGNYATSTFGLSFVNISATTWY